MREGVIHRRLVFPVRAELRPIVGDGHSVIHQPALSLDVQRYCRHRLGDGEHRKERVSIDLPPSGCIGEATPDIDDLFAIHIGRYLQADLAAFANGGVNGFLDNAIRVRCHSSPSHSFLDQPICPSSHSLSSGDIILAFIAPPLASAPPRPAGARTSSPWRDTSRWLWTAQLGPAAA